MCAFSSSFWCMSLNWITYNTYIALHMFQVKNKCIFLAQNSSRNKPAFLGEVLVLARVKKERESYQMVLASLYLLDRSIWKTHSCQQGHPTGVCKLAEATQRWQENACCKLIWGISTALHLLIYLLFCLFQDCYMTAKEMFRICAYSHSKFPGADLSHIAFICVQLWIQLAIRFNTEDCDVYTQKAY